MWMKTVSYLAMRSSTVNCCSICRLHGRLIVVLGCDFVSDIYFVHNCYAPFEDMWTIRNGNSLSGLIIDS